MGHDRVNAVNVTVKKEIVELIGRRLKQALSANVAEEEKLPMSIQCGLEMLRQAELQRAALQVERPGQGEEAS